MFGSKKSPLKVKKGPAEPVASGLNPFDSDDDLDMEKKQTSSQMVPSGAAQVTPSSSINPFDDDEYGDRGSSSSNSHSWSARNNYKNDFRDSGGIQNQSVQELENYAVYKAEETTKAVNGCLKIANEIREDATETLVTLHQQGEQITRTHMAAANIDHDLSRGEKLLGSLGGMFSKTWKPKKNHTITGPVIIGDDTVRRKGNHLEQRERLGLSRVPREQSNSKTPVPEPTTALQQVEAEKVKQDDALSDLSNMLGELKEMALDMGSEIERQNVSLDDFHKDVGELDNRVRDATRRGRHLVGK